MEDQPISTETLSLNFVEQLLSLRKITLKSFRASNSLNEANQQKDFGKAQVLDTFFSNLCGRFSDK